MAQLISWRVIAFFAMLALPHLTLAASETSYWDGRCSPTPKIQSRLSAWKSLRQAMFATRDWFDAGLKLSARTAAAFEIDLYVQREHDAWQYLDVNRREATILARQIQAEKSPSPASRYLYGRLLAQEQRPSAVSLLGQLVRDYPKFPQARLLLAYAFFDLGGPTGQDRGAEEVEAYRRLCPENVEGFSFIAQFPQSDIAKNQLRELRILLGSLPAEKALAHIQAYWSGARIVYAGEELAASKDYVRQWMLSAPKSTIEADLESLERAIRTADFVGARTEADRLRALVLKRYPSTQAANAVRRNAWEAAMASKDAAAPSVRGVSPTSRRELIHEELRYLPYSPELQLARFNILRAEGSSSDADILASGLELHRTLRSPYMGMPLNPPPTLLVADEFVARGIGRDAISALLQDTERDLSRMRTVAARGFGVGTLARKQFDSELTALEVTSLGLAAETAAAQRNFQAADISISSARRHLNLLSSLAESDRAYPIYLSALSRHYRSVSSVEEARGNLSGAIDALRSAKAYDEVSTPGAFKRAQDVISLRLLALERRAERERSASAETNARQSSFLNPRATKSWEQVHIEFPRMRIPELSGTYIDTSDWRGKFVIVSYWATWCAPCRVELEHLSEFAQQLRERNDVLVVTVSLDDDAERAREYVARNRILLPVGLGWDIRASLPNAQSGVVPLNFVVERDGIARMRSVGSSRTKSWLDEVRELVSTSASAK